MEKKRLKDSIKDNGRNKKEKYSTNIQEMKRRRHRS